MAFQIHIALVLLIVLTVELDAKAVSLNDGASVSTGQLYALGETGALHSLHKRDVQALRENEQHRIRLHFDDESFPLDMDLRQGSVWSENSEFVIRNGDRTIKVPLTRDSSCYMHGQVSSHGGAVTINRCGTLTGDIHIPGHHIHLEEMPPPVGDTEQQYNTKLKVTKKKTDDEIIGKIESEVLDHMDSLEPANITSREKRDTDSITIEVAIFVDKGYTDYLSSDKGITELDDVVQWFVQKWDLVASVYEAGAETIGADITIEMRKIEIWRENMENYPENSIGVSPRLRWFCHNTQHADDYDQKVLYTKGTGGSALGLAYLGGTCRRRAKCYLIKTSRESVRVEIHELGHSIGLPHDPVIGDCGDVQGFMGWVNTYRYLPCYKRTLISELRRPHYGCLFTKNVKGQDTDISYIAK